MSNYLQNLIAKNFNQAKVARPRLASMFEPLAPSASLAFGKTQLIERLDFEHTTDAEPNLNTGQENRYEFKPMEGKNDSSLPMLNQPSTEIETSVWRGNQLLETFEPKIAGTQIRHRQPTPQHQIEVQPAALQASEDAHQEKVPTNSPLANFQESKRQLTRQRNLEATPKNALPPGGLYRQQGEKNPLKPSLPPNSNRPVPTSVQDESAPIRRPINKPTAEPEVSSLAYSPGASQANKIIVQPRIALPRENQATPGKVIAALQQPTAQAAEIPTTPTINVTIGRIEVRATTPAAQPRKQAPVAQTLSLDEYLRRRNRGGGE